MYLLFDIGGTKMRLASSFDHENIHEVKVVVTPPHFEEGLKIIKDYVSKADSSRTDRIICCGLPGVLDKEKTSLLTAPNLPYWTREPIKERFSELISGSVYLENDADLAGLGEAVKGAGMESKIVAFITVGTGVGGVRIVDGKIDQSSQGFEPGHQIIDVDGSLFSEKKSNIPIELEKAVSGTALKLRFGKVAQEISERNVWDEVEKYLAVGLTNTIVHWSPDVVVLGGGVVQTEYLSVERIKEYIGKVLKVFPVLPEIKKGNLGEEAGLVGALIYLRQISSS